MLRIQPGQLELLPPARVAEALLPFELGRRRLLLGLGADPEHVFLALVDFLAEPRNLLGVAAQAGQGPDFFTKRFPRIFKFLDLAGEAGLLFRKVRRQLLDFEIVLARGALQASA